MTVNKAKAQCVRRFGRLPTYGYRMPFYSAPMVKGSPQFGYVSRALVNSIAGWRLELCVGSYPCHRRYVTE